MLRRHPLPPAALAIVLILIVACSSGDPAGDAQAQLDELFAEVWTSSFENSAALRLREGLPVERLDDPSFEAFQEAVAEARGWLDRLDALLGDGGSQGSNLSHASWINARALQWDLANLVESERWFWHGNVLSGYTSPIPPAAQVVNGMPLGSEEQRAEYLDLLSQVGPFVTALENRVRSQIANGVFLWEANHAASLALHRSFLSDSGRGGLFALADVRTASLPADVGEELSRQAAEVISGSIDPAIESLISLLDSDDYRAGLPEEVGASRLPDGQEYYRFRVKQMTTMDVTPEEVHERGVALVASMEEEMEELRREIAAKYDVSSEREVFRNFLRTDPRFFPQSPEEVAKRLMDAAEAMEAVVDEYFSSRPEADYGVRRLGPALEGSQTYGIYRPATPADPVGRYNYNGSKLDERSWLNLRAVSLHELVPGHHFHIARQAENTSLPDYRRNTWHGAFTEGWGSYSSLLGLEAGVYEGDPLSAYGMYILEVFLATRLIVDTGMNSMGWSLERGRETMRRHTLESETQIQTESLRYSADMPGQALAYQMGKLKLLDLRQKASRELGSTFVLRDFHEAILENGSLPMDVLEEHIDWWIEQQRAR